MPDLRRISARAFATPRTSLGVSGSFTTPPFGCFSTQWPLLSLPSCKVHPWVSAQSATALISDFIFRLDGRDIGPPLAAGDAPVLGEGALRGTRESVGVPEVLPSGPPRAHGAP